MLTLSPITIVALLVLALLAGAALVLLLPCIKTRGAYWTGYAAGRLRKLAKAEPPLELHTSAIGNLVVCHRRSNAR